MIKHFCDGCRKEVKSYATLLLYPKWKRIDVLGGSPLRYELCNECYDKLGDIILNIPDNSPEVKQ